MRRFISFLSLIWIVFFTSSCVPESIIPYGVWASENPNIIIYFDSDYQSPEWNHLYVGFYTIEGTETRILARIGYGSRFRIFHHSAFDRSSGISGSPIVYGEWTIENNQMHYMFNLETQERIGHEKIIFNKLDKYDPINPEDWFNFDEEEDDCEEQE